MKQPAPGPAQDRYRMRRLTDEELAELIRLARDGRTGPTRAIDALWELILRDAHGATLAHAAERGFHVQDYAMAADQAEQLKVAMVERRRLPRKVVDGFRLTWAMYSPADWTTPATQGLSPTPGPRCGPVSAGSRYESVPRPAEPTATASGVSCRLVNVLPEGQRTVEAMVEPTVLWRSGDSWRDLGPPLDGVDAVTVISLNGTARFLDLAGGRHNRLSLEGGHVMWLDSQWRPLATGSGPGGWGLAITPCGLNVLGGFDWAMGTPLWAVLGGLWSAAPAIGGSADWTATALGRELLDAIAAGERPTYGPGHPDEACGAAYCQKARASR